MMIEFLRLCGYRESELESELPRVEKTFKKLGITVGDIEQGKQRLSRYYDIELEGVRKALRLCLRELAGTTLAREEGKEKIVGGFMAPGFEVIGSLLTSFSGKISASHYSFIHQVVLSSIFDKMTPVLQAAEKRWLKAGAAAHCGNLKTITGLISLELVPKPDLMVTSGFLCEAAPKTVNMMHEVYNIPVYYYGTCQDRESDKYSDATKRSVDFASKSMRKLIDRLEEVTGFEITDNMVKEVLHAREAIDSAIRKIRDLVESSDPLPLSMNNDVFLTCMHELTLSLDTLPEVLDALNTIYEELQERVRKGVGVVEKGTPRVLTLLPPNAADPRLESLMYDLGIAPVTSDYHFNAPFSGTVEGPYAKMILRSQLTSMATVVSEKIPVIIDGLKKLKVVGVLGRYNVGCRIVAADILLVKEAIEKLAGIPVMLLELDSFDPRFFNEQEYRRRLEVFKTMMKAR
jgi:benzoyl-CoA reductase/2-hydroxyglutaryl-CoA dehydratase subunit BcrC/BadD/HgdB